MDVSLITVSYRGDYALAAELCASVEAYVPADIEHVLVVPRADVALFLPLKTKRRRIVLVEDLLPTSWRQLPLPSRIATPFGTWRPRSLWATPQGLMRGWVLQQIVKLSCDIATPRGTLVFADSDIVFVRPLAVDRLFRDNRTRLYHRTGETKDSERHRAWHRAAAEILGHPATDYFGADYIGNLITWRRDTLVALHEHIAKVTGRDWQAALAGRRALSEYILYGAFAEHVLGEASGHYLDTEDLVHASWHYDLANAQSRAAFQGGLEPHHVAVLIQSTEDMAPSDRRRFIKSMTDKSQQAA
jgi:hypothetical protein